MPILELLDYCIQIIVSQSQRLCAVPDGRKTLKTNIKIIATSLALASSVGAWAGIGGLNVQSHLGQPFSGSIVVTGDEAEALKSNRRVTVSGSGIRGTVVPQANGSVVVRLRSSSPIREPMITFSVSAGRQTREYNAMLDPSGYTPEPAPRRVEKPVKEPRRKPAESTSGSLNKGEVDFVGRTKNPTIENTMPVETKRPRVVEESSDDGETALRPTREARQPRQARTQNQTAPATTGAVNSVRKSGKGAVSTRRHRAQVGETLSSIADRYRPRNMSLQTASRALAMANPAAFKRGNTIQRATTLYIPTAAQWHAYAQRAQSQATHAPQPRRAAVPAHNPNLDMGVDNSVNTQPENPPVSPAPKKAPPAQPPVAPPAQTPVVPDKTAQPATPPAQPPAAPAKTPATAPNNTQQPAAVPPTTGKVATASAPAKTVAPTQAASAPAKAVAPVKPASTPATVPVQAASTAAPVAVSPAAMPSAPSAPVNEPIPAEQPEPAMTEPVTEEDMEEEGINWGLYGGIGGALGVVLLVGHLLRKRRSENPPEEEDDDVEWETDSDSSPASRIKPNALASHDDDHDFDVNAEDDDFETVSDDDDEDDVFFADTAAAAAGVAAAKSEKSEFNLNNFEPDVSSFGLTSDSTANANSTDDDWTWDTPSATEAPDGFDSFNTDKADDSAGSDWSLDDGADLPSSAEYSLDAIDQLSNEIDKTSFDEFGAEDDFIQAAAPNKPQAAVDDIDAMFANALANLDDLASNTQPEKPKPAAAELDDIDAMFAGALANLGGSKTKAAAALEDDELAAFEQPKPKSAAAELDDIDSMFAGALANLDNLAHESHPNDDLMTANELDSLNSLGSFDDALLEKPIANPLAEADDLDALFANKFNTTAAAPADEVDDIDAMFANELNELDNLNALSELDSFSDESSTVASSQPVDDIDAMFANELNELDSLNVSSQPVAPLADSFAEFGDNDEFTTSVNVNTEDDIDALFANELENLNSLSELNDLEEDLGAHVKLSSLNALSEFDELAELESSAPAPVVHDDIDALFANALSDIDEPLVSEPAIKPIMSEEDIENLNSLSELDSLEANEPSADDLFADALNDLTVGAELDDVNALAFESPVLDVAPMVEETPLDDINAMAFDLSAFDALQNTATETSATETALDDVDAMSFDLSGFDALTETAAEEPAFDNVDTLAFAAPEIPDAPVETPELTTPAVDFDLPEIPSADLDDFTASLNELETAGDFMEFDLPATAEGAGFVSGAVGTGETLEAKLELATMYVEIDDADAARIMLNELIAEADGEVLAKAKTLLNQLG